MLNIKVVVVFCFGVFISNYCSSQDKKPTKKTINKDSVYLSKFIKSARRDLVTNESIRKNKQKHSLKTLAIYYDSKTILAPAKND